MSFFSGKKTILIVEDESDIAEGMKARLELEHFDVLLANDGKKGVEIAFELHRNDNLLGWLVFQADMDLMRKIHGVGLQDLKALQFDRP